MQKKRKKGKKGTDNFLSWVNEPRNLAIYLSRRLSRLRLKDIVDQFGLGSYSSVSSVVGRTGKLLSQDRNLAERLRKIGAELRKSQAKT